MVSLPVNIPPCWQPSISYLLPTQFSFVTFRLLLDGTSYGYINCLYALKLSDPKAVAQSGTLVL